MEPVRKGYKKTELGVVPDDWAVRELKDVVNVIGGGAFKSVDSKTDGIKWLKISNVGINEISWKDESFLPSNFLFDFKSFVLYEGDYVMALTRPILDRRLKIARLGKNDAPAMLNQRVGKLISNQNVDFVYFLFQKHQVITALLESMAGTDPPNLSNKGIYSIKVPLPPTLTEQKAIADALSDVDKLIASLEKLIAKKKAIKQGTMQALLTPPHKGGKRLEGFSGEWKEVKLGEICRITKGQLITEKTRRNGDIPVIAGGKSPAYFHDKANRFGKTITISASGASAGYVSFHSNSIFASDCSTIEESEGYCIEFIYLFLQSIQQIIYKMQTGGAQPHIHPKDLSPIKFWAPLKQEQIRISEFLTGMESEIMSLEKKHTKLSALKQGMMQELLTGKTRLV